MAANELKADDLIRDLAELRRGEGWVVWTSMPLGSVWNGTPKDPTGIVDVYALRKSYTAPQATIYEVKISRGDFLRDVNRAKYTRYLKHCNLLLFAAPAGMLTKSEIPEECGLIVRGPKGWQVQKVPQHRQWAPNPELLLALIFRGYQEFKQGRDLQDRERWQRNLTLSEAAAEFGIHLARRIATAEELIGKADVLAARIGEALGKDFKGDFGSALYAAQSETELLLGRHRLAPDALRLVQICRQMLDGQATGWMAQELEECAARLRKG